MPSRRRASTRRRMAHLSVPSVQAFYVLEVTAGFVKQNNITMDSVLSIISI